jgi:hypothetical protein
MTNVQERGAAGIAPAQISAPSRFQGSVFTAGGYETGMRPDFIRRTGPQYWMPPQGGGLQSGWDGMLAQLRSIVQQLLSMLGLQGAQSGQQYFASANASSTGDPHLSFTGTSADGSHAQTHYDSMTGHSDLLDSASFAGGYQISTSVTQPGANGVTYNQQAAVSTDFGTTQVSLDRSGNAAILRDGQTTSLANGQSIDLGNGEVVTRNADGSVAIRDDNGLGGAITTTLSENGQGVDVNVQASNVDLGGDLLNRPPQQIGRPLPVRIPLERA